MLVVTPTAPCLADRKPRVISEIRKAHVQRSPSLDGLPRLSGVLNYYCESLGVWTPRSVAVRDGSLLVYGPDCTLYDYTPSRSYASLGRSTTPRRLPLHPSYSDPPASLPCDIAEEHGNVYGYFSSKNLMHDSIGYFPNTNLMSGSNSLSRISGTTCQTRSAEFRLPLRHLNLMPSSLAPRAFSLSCRQTSDGTSPVAVFQALSQLEYERWVKTLAVEIIRQTPLDAIRFLDVLGIASITIPKPVPAVSSKTSANGKIKLTRSSKILDSSMRNSANKNKAIKERASRRDRSPSSEGSTTSADFISNGIIKAKSETILRSKRAALVKQSLPRRKLRMSDVESQSDKDEVDCPTVKTTPICTVTTDAHYGSGGRRSREKIRRAREGFENGSSSEETRAPDEGIVIEERCSSSDRSCRRSLWPSDRSDCLDSPRSVSSYSSYEFYGSPDTTDSSRISPLISNVVSVDTTDEADCIVKEIAPVSERVYCKNTPVVTNHANLIKKKCEKRALLEKIVPAVHKAQITAVCSSNVLPVKEHLKIDTASKSLPMPLYRAQPYINDAPPVTIPHEKLSKRVEFNAVNKPSHINETNFSIRQNEKGTPKIVVERSLPWEPSVNLKESKLWNRARSCSPNTKTGRSPPRFPSCGRGTRAFSAGQESLPTVAVQATVEALKQRCQNTENYVPVKEKLALFESLCRAGRLARSSEELAAAEQSAACTPRARSLHDLTRSRSPQVAVRERCKFFENFGDQITDKKPSKSPVGFSGRRFSESIPILEKSPHKQQRSKENKKSTNLPDIDNDVFTSKRDSIQLKDKQKHDSVFPLQIIKVLPNHNKSNDSKHNNVLGAGACEALNYGSFKQIREGNKIITYV